MAMTDAEPAAAPPADAFVLYGATGDLAARMLVPALCRVAARRPFAALVAVGHDAVDAGVLRSRVRDHVGAIDAAQVAAFDALAARIAFVGGDLGDDTVFARVAAALQHARRPIHYLAIPPALFAPALDGLARAKLAADARVAIEKPFGHDLASAIALDGVVARTLAPSQVFRIDHFLAKDPVRNLADMRARAAWLDALWSRATIDAIEVTMAEAFGVGTRGAFYESTGVLRDVFQNHLLELVALATMEPCAPADSEGFARSRIAALRAIAPLAPRDVVYGQYDGYRGEAGVARDSQVATYLAVRLVVHAPRLAGVPILVRAGKAMAVTATTLTLRLAGGDRLCFRLGPGATGITLATERLVPGSRAAHTPVALDAPAAHDEDRDAYVNVIEALVTGDTSVSAHAEGVHAAWRVVEPVLRAAIPVHRYGRSSFGPAAAGALLPPGTQWIDPEARA
jgi:glucose-6-phosphate 1-dehydrogenase